MRSLATAPSEISVLEPASSGGLKALDRALVRLQAHKLQAHKRLLVIAAHPDDEDIEKLSLLKDMGVDQFGLYLMHDDMDGTLQAYGEGIIDVVG